MNKGKNLIAFIFYFFLFITFNGAIRKWYLETTLSKNILFAIQIIFPLGLFYYFRPIRNNQLRNGLYAYLIALLVLAFHPLNLTVWHGLIGMILYIAFPLFLYVYIENKSSFNIEKYVKPMAIVVAIQFILAAIQYQLPPSHILNTYADVEKVGGSIAVVGTSARVTGTFSYISGFTSFLVFYNYYIWYLFKRGLHLNYFIVLFAIGLYVNLISGSRGATYGYILFFFVFFLSERNSFNLISLLRTFFPLLALAVIYLGLQPDTLIKAFSTAFENFDQRSAQGIESGEALFRIFWDLEGLINFSGNYPLFGVGLGASYQGATAIFGTSDYVKEFGYYEGELVRIVLEGGFFLLIMKSFICYFFAKELEFPKPLKYYTFLQILYLSQTVFNVYNTSYMAIGLILLDNAYRNIGIQDLNKRKLFQ